VFRRPDACASTDSDPASTLPPVRREDERSGHAVGEPYPGDAHAARDGENMENGVSRMATDGKNGRARRLVTHVTMFVPFQPTRVLNDPCRRALMLEPTRPFQRNE
jgi:hypothetical protein